jgi:hypothetical protein
MTAEQIERDEAEHRERLAATESVFRGGIVLTNGYEAACCDESYQHPKYNRAAAKSVGVDRAFERERNDRVSALSAIAERFGVRGKLTPKPRTAKPVALRILKSDRGETFRNAAEASRMLRVNYANLKTAICTGRRCAQRRWEWIKAA